MRRIRLISTEHNSNKLDEFVQQLNYWAQEHNAQIIDIEYLNGYWFGFIETTDD